MKIDDIEVIHLSYQIPADRHLAYAGGHITARVTSLVRVLTDDGLIGWGSAYSHPGLVQLIVEEHLKPFLIGKDPSDVQTLWWKMYRLTRWYGRKGAAISAVGALDIAFWDLLGKSEGRPVYELMGGKGSSVPAYASALLWSDDLDQLCDEATAYVSQGFRRMKMRLGRSEAYDLAAVRAIRQAVGPDIDLLVDGSMRYSPALAEKMARVLEGERVFWFEEPFEPEDIDSYAQLRQQSAVPIAAGENEFGLQGFQELLRAGAVDIVQPDASRAGGITECYRIGQMAAQHEARAAPHTWSDAVALVANMHVVSALTNALTVEMDRTGNPFIDELLVQPLRIKDGELHFSQSPGLGIHLDERVVERYRLPRDSPLPEGVYSDMIFGAQYDTPAAPYGQES